MTKEIAAGRDVLSGTYRCTECYYPFHVPLMTHLPPCPACGNALWSTDSLWADGEDREGESEPDG